MTEQVFIKDFIYELICTESRLTMANRAYYGLQNHMKSRIISRNTKTLLYKTLIRPVLTYGAETWVLSKQDEHRLSIFERKILRRIYGPVMDVGRWRIRTNQELYQQCGENDTVKFCKLSRLRWAGHVIRQDDDDLSRRVLLSEPGGKRPRGRPRLRWEDGVEEDVARLGCMESSRPKPGRMEETPKGDRGPPWAVAPLKRRVDMY